MVKVAKRIIETATLLSVLYAARRYYRNWGATKAECQMRLPGDALVGDPVVQTTEAVYIDAPPAAVWSWLLRKGHERSGGVQDAAGAGYQGTDRVHPERQLAVGDQVRLAPPGWMGLAGGVTLRVVEIAPEKHVLLAITHPDLRRNAVWSFHLQPHWENRVRLLTRARIGLRYPGEFLALELARPVIALGARGLLLGIKRGVERLPMTEPEQPHPAETA